MFEASTLGLATAFGAGLVSFLSPCVLTIVPAYVSYVAGQPPQGTPSRLDARGRIGAAALSACFVLGFGTVFVALGSSATSGFIRALRAATPPRPTCSASRSASAGRRASAPCSARSSP